MVNYYFISSPFHLFVACSLAQQNNTDTNIVILNPRESANKTDYGDLLKQNKTIFDDVISFENAKVASKIKERKRRFQLIKIQFKRLMPDRVYTGNDRRVEFQFAMGFARRFNKNVPGIYMDEGVVTYLGHKSMFSIQHKYIDPLLKKVAYGLWWKNPLTIGSSQWISDVYAAFPALVHPLLQKKNVKPIQHQYFDTEVFKLFCESLLETYPVDIQNLKKINAVIILTHESFYHEGVEHIIKLINRVKDIFPESEIAIKAHPRSQCQSLLVELYPDLLHINHKVGMEMILPVLNKKAFVIGDVSSVLFTTRWLRPELKVAAVKLENSKRQKILLQLEKLYQSIDISMTDLNSLPSLFES